MSAASRKLIVGTLIAIAGGGAVGWLYNAPITGLLLGALLVIAVYMHKLLRFEQAVRHVDSDSFAFGDGVWQQLFSRFKYERERGNRYEKQYRRVIKEIQKSTNAMPDGAVVIDGNNEIVTCNRAAKSLIGLKRKKDRGQKIDNIYRNPGLTQLLADNDARQTADLESPLRENEWLNCRIVPYGADQKLVLIRDVTDRITLNKIRRDFVANASHELRSPLTVINGYLETLADDPQIPEDLAQPLSQMQIQARRMTAIIKDLLELSRLEAEGHAATDEMLDVGVLVTGVIESLDVEQDEPTIISNIASTAKLLGAENDINSVLRNLLANAVRHTQGDGEVEVIWRTDNNGGDLVVRDTGEGIAPEHIARLTERFFRVDRGRSRVNGGFGLGLAIVKHAVERHGGELRISSEPGVGSEFCCRFPADRLVFV